MRTLGPSAPVPPASSLVLDLHIPASTTSFAHTTECCSLPPVKAEYTHQGEYITFAGLKTYAVGPKDTGKAVLFTYDVFGFVSAAEFTQCADGSVAPDPPG